MPKENVVLRSRYDSSNLPIKNVAVREKRLLHNLEVSIFSRWIQWLYPNQNVSVFDIIADLWSKNRYIGLFFVVMRWLAIVLLLFKFCRLVGTETPLYNYIWFWKMIYVLYIVVC